MGSGVHAVGEGRGCGSPQRTPGPGPFWVSRGRGRAPLLRAFAESQLSQRKGPRDSVTRSFPFYSRGRQGTGSRVSWKSSWKVEPWLRWVASDPYCFFFFFWEVVVESPLFSSTVGYSRPDFALRECSLECRRLTSLKVGRTNVREKAKASFLGGGGGEGVPHEEAS